jgi:hypothetical protein
MVMLNPKNITHPFPPLELLLAQLLRLHQAPAEGRSEPMQARPTNLELAQIQR